jgi:hypothetical protein
MDFLAFILMVIAAGMLVYNVFCLWGNTAFGGDMGGAILFHQGNLLAAVTVGLALLVHPGVTWYWCFAPIIAIILSGVPSFMLLSFIFRRIRGS